MKSLITIFTLLFIMETAFTQDLIVWKDSTTLDCEIYKADSLQIFYKYRSKGRIVTAETLKNDIAYYVMDHKGAPSYTEKVKTPLSTVNKFTQKPYKTALTIGILQGGGSLIGLDFEAIFAKRFGVQIGAGIVGYGAGLNLHFKPTIRSSMVSFQYWHQGLGSNYTQSVASANYVFRGKKWFTFQIGLGLPFEYGPGFDNNPDRPDVILTYAIGGYIPF